MEWLVRDLHEELKSWGYPGGDENVLTIKSDGESPIKVVREALASKHGGRAVPELPPKGEHQSNGVAEEVEEAGNTIREMVKVLKDQLEFQTGIQIQSTDVIMQWVVHWAAMLLSRSRRDEAGQTPHERARG